MKLGRQPHKLVLRPVAKRCASRQDVASFRQNTIWSPGHKAVQSRKFFPKQFGDFRSPPQFFLFPNARLLANRHGLFYKLHACWSEPNFVSTRANLLSTE